MKQNVETSTRKNLKDGAPVAQSVFRTAFRHGPACILVQVASSDLVPRSIVEASNRACELLGYSRDELLLLSLQDVIPPEVSDDYSVALTEARGLETIPPHRITLLRKDRSHRVASVAHRFLDAGGEPVMLSTFTEWSGDHCDVQQQAPWDAVCSNVFNSMKDFVSVHDGNYRIIRANKALTDFLGVNEEDIVGSFCYELLHGTDAPCPTCPHVATKMNGKPATILVENSRIGIPLEATCVPYRDEAGALLGSIHIARDISGQRSAEREKDLLISELKLALNDVKRLSGLLQICCKCKKIRDDEGTWKPLEIYIRDRSEAEFSHGYCPTCLDESYREEAFG